MERTADVSQDVRWDGRGRYNRDQEIEADLNKLLSSRGISALEAVNQFPIFARRVHIKKFLAHYELFRHSIELPGDIVELGVFRGLSLLTFANFLEVCNIGDRTKKVYGFDNFAGFQQLTAEDGPEYQRVQKQPGGYDPSSYLDELREVIAVFDEDRFVPWKPRIELVMGNIEESVPKFVADNPGLRISLLHFDCDLYQPTKAGLDHLFPLVVKGGVVVFDEYGILEWGGESRAVDEYFEGTDYSIKKFPWHGSPGGYIIK